MQAAGFEALHYEIEGPHRMVTTTVGQGWRMPPEMLKPTESLTRSGLFGPWDAPDLGVDPLPGINPGQREELGPRLVPGLAELRDPDLGTRLVPHVSLLADVV